MSAPSQVRVRTAQVPLPTPEVESVAVNREQDDPVELLRNVVSRLKAPGIGLPDKAQLTQLLAEAQQALERANGVARAMAESQELVAVGQFDQALEIVGEALLVYADDPALAARYAEIERQKQAHQTAARARTVIEEADWLLNQNRADLAVQFLREKAAEFRDDAAIHERLQAVEALLPEWQEERNVRATLARAATLEQPQQWEAALTILEEALQLYPDSEELLAAAQHLRLRVAVHEREKKLERRLDRIAHLTATQSWNQALTLLESTKSEFPGTPGLDPIRSEIQRGLRRAECESVVTEVRQWLSDGELDLAEVALATGREALGQDSVFDALEQQLASDRAYREQLRGAQVCFGRRQFAEAERILTSLAVDGREEAIALLDAVKMARADSEEENFLERGREKALALMQEQQFAQAADLLSNLLSLFPDDPILRRDLAAAKSSSKVEAPPVPVPAAQKEASPEFAPIPVPVPRPLAAIPTNARAPQSRFRTATVAGAASILLVSGTGGAWILARSRTASPKAASTPAAVQRQSEATAALQPPPLVQAAPVTSASVPGRESPASNSVPAPKVIAADPEPRRESKLHPSRIFVAPAARQTETQNSAAALPTPPRTEPLPGPEVLHVLPPAILGTSSLPTPPPPAPVSVPAPSAVVPEKPRPVTGGVATAARLIKQIPPVYPQTALKHGLVGDVKIQAIVDEHGDLTNVKVLSGDAVLVAAAKTAVMQWKYVPSTLNGKPVAAPISIVISFENKNH